MCGHGVGYDGTVNSDRTIHWLLEEYEVVKTFYESH